MTRVLFVTGSDSKQYGLATECLRSVQQHAAHLPHDVAFFDLGCSPDQVAELQAAGQLVRPVQWEFGVQNRIPQAECRKGQICRPFLPQYFPDHDIFFWIDADAWVQDRTAIDQFVEAASTRGAGLVPEIERSSKFFHGGLDAYLGSMKSLYRRVYGTSFPDRFANFINLNAGVFCFHRDSHLWDLWKQSLQETIRMFLGQKPDNNEIVAIFGLIDQVALNVGIRQHGLPSEIEYLPLTCNWTCHLALPAYDEQRSLLVEPYLPHAAIGIIHLTNPWGGDMALLPHPHERRSRRWHPHGAGKDFYADCRLETTAGGSVVGSLRFSGSGSFVRHHGLQPINCRVAPAQSGVIRPYDYVSPGLTTIWPDASFPHMIEGNPEDCGQIYLRKRSPHRWMVDRRNPAVGFLSRDESAILHSAALQCCGKRGLEIGCCQGWAACHIASAGILLDVIDPVFANPQFTQTIESSLQKADVRGNVKLHAAQSPNIVDALASSNGEKWSFFFLDGTGEGDAALNETTACLPHAAEDCIMLIHNIANPDVAKGFMWLKSEGWNTCVFHTSQIMGAAWRGSMSPPLHIPDPCLVELLGVPLHISDLLATHSRS